jgi:AraC-like DNA-binding protein
MDALTGLLKVIHTEGHLFSRFHAGGCWGVSTRGAASGIFHLVLEGSGVLVLEGQPPVPFCKGDLLFLPHGSAHHLADSPSTCAIPIPLLPNTVGADGLVVVQAGHPSNQEPPEVSILCGTLKLDQESQKMLLPQLPLLIRVQGKQPTFTWVEATLKLVAEEAAQNAPGADLLLARLADLLLLQLLRCWLVEGKASGWLAGLSEPVVARAIALMHHEPERDWTAEELAKRVGVSRSLLYTTFTEAAGEPPGAYLLRWRIWVAKGALKNPKQSVAEVGRQVGYASEAAFSRAFTRVVGSTPSHWRRSQ